MLEAFPFDRPGEPEFILLMAGLIEVRDRKAVPTVQLEFLFDGKPLPPMEELMPVLLQIAEAAAIELGGALSVRRRQDRAQSALEKMGMTHTSGSLSELFIKVRKGAERAALELEICKELTRGLGR